MNLFNARLGVWLLSLMFCEVTVAQPLTYQFRHLDVNDGLSHNQVTSFLKDRKGFLWVGTNSGLNRFDGYAFKTYMSDTENPFSISNNFIGSLAEAPDGKLCVFTGAGLNIY